MLRNYMEDVVEDVFNEVVHQYDGVCGCEVCLEDIKAITLNNLKPAYSVTTKGSSFLKTNELKVQFRTDVIVQLAKAIGVVKNNPRHD